jgi:hypothetical protein
MCCWRGFLLRLHVPPFGGVADLGFVADIAGNERKQPASEEKAMVFIPGDVQPDGKVSSWFRLVDFYVIPQEGGPNVLIPVVDVSSDSE